MTPAELAVIEAAMSWAWTPSETGKLDPIIVACTALRAERAERTIPYSKVTAEDEIYSVKTQRWYRVLSTKIANLSSDPLHVRLELEGVHQPLTVLASDDVLCRRSPRGQAVDVFIQVFES